MNPFQLLKSPVYLYRLAHWLHAVRIPVLPHLIDYFSRFFFTCWLPHTAKIGENLEIGYGGMGCVFHSNCTIGDNVHVGTHVTFGGNARKKGPPTVGNNVYIGNGAQILGPITVGDGSVIGANSVVIDDVPPRTVVVGCPARIVHENIDIQDYLFHLRDSQIKAD